MNIIIPMAGMGKRMRPHTLSVPKPLIPIAGKPIVQRLVEDIVKVCGKPVGEIGFVIGHFGTEVESNLIRIAESVGARGRIYFQEEAFGTAHAVHCAADLLKGETVIAFADTLFKADFTIESEKEGVIFVQKVEDPRQFGVIKLDSQGHISDFVEKPQEFVSDMAIIGIYYFRDGAHLGREIQYLLDNNIKEKGEYQLTNALENMKMKGVKFYPGAVSEWLDCGNKDATVFTNQRYLEYLKGTSLVSKTSRIARSLIIEPSFIGENVIIENSVVGPHVSIGDGTKIENSIVNNSIVQQEAHIKNQIINNSLIGSYVKLEGKAKDLSLGDYNTSFE